MPIQYDQCFIRQKFLTTEKVGFVIPKNAQMVPEIRETLLAHYGTADLGLESDPPHKFSFHHINAPLDDALLDDGAVINTGGHRFLARDGVMGVFDLLAPWGSDFCWSFCSTSQILVLAAITVGQTLDVRFDHEFERVFHVKTAHVPSGVPDSGYGQYAVQLAVELFNSKGFRIVSSFEPQSKRTASRLPFFFYFRVFGTMKNDPEYPVWRVLLAESIRQFLLHQYPLALLYVAFSLESFMDQLLSTKLSHSGVAETYIDHILKVAEKKYELHALNNRGLREKEVNRLAENLNKTIFTPRNRLAHGKVVVAWY